ncbi:RsfA family transcription factor [Alkalibacillus flavidus]|uniref:RsfA family transcription factor n=1 Tax=Alkalibacillus flavidus TaxID=546021 RepID=A0ABV2KSD2_9BACI
MTTRQDAWTKDEDLLLAETVIRYIREGRTQMKAFERVGKQLNRTAQACGFRWNANLRRQYEQAIHLAKQDRKQLGRQSQHTLVKDSPKQEVERFDELIAQLERLKAECGELDQETSDIQELKQQLKSYQLCMTQIYDLTKPFVESSEK